MFWVCEWTRSLSKDIIAYLLLLVADGSSVQLHKPVHACRRTWRTWIYAPGWDSMLCLRLNKLHIRGCANINWEQNLTMTARDWHAREMKLFLVKGFQKKTDIRKKAWRGLREHESGYSVTLVTADKSSSFELTRVSNAAIVVLYLIIFILYTHTLPGVSLTHTNTHTLYIYIYIYIYIQGD